MVVTSTAFKGGWAGGPITYTQAGAGNYALNYNGFMTYFSPGAFQTLQESAQNKNSGLNLNYQTPQNFVNSLNTSQAQGLGLIPLAVKPSSSGVGGAGSANNSVNQALTNAITGLENSLNNLTSPTVGGMGGVIGAGSSGGATSAGTPGSISGSTLILIGIAAAVLIGIVLVARKK